MLVVEAAVEIPLEDLVADLEPFWASLGTVNPFLVPEGAPPDRERQQTPDEFLKIDPSTTCILCASCFSDCNVREVDDGFIGPASLGKAHRFIFDSRDSSTPQRMREISETGGVWDCTHCGECSTRCPTDGRLSPPTPSSSIPPSSRAETSATSRCAGP